MWGVFSKFYNICSRKSNVSTIIKPKNLSFYNNENNKSLKIVSFIILMACLLTIIIPII